MWADKRNKRGLTAMATPRACINMVLNWFEEPKERVPIPCFSRSSPDKSSSRTLRIELSTFR